MEAYRTEKVMEYTEGAEFLTEMDTNLMFKTLDKIKVFEKETESKCKNEVKCRMRVPFVTQESLFVNENLIL